MKNFCFLLAFASTLTACGPNEKRASSEADGTDKRSAETSPDGGLKALQFAEVSGKPMPLDPALSMLETQVMLDRAGFSPGVIDGKRGKTLELALREFQITNNIEASGTIDAATTEALSRFAVPATRLVRIPAAFVTQNFVPDFPEKAEQQAELPGLGYRNIMEALSERFHTTPETLVALNSPDTKVGVGSIIRVPNIAEVPMAMVENDERGWARTLHMLGVSSDQPAATKVVVDKSEAVLRVFDADDKLIAAFPATMGSSRDPLPLGNWTIKGVARNPEFHYNPKLFWDISDSKDNLLLPPGPNSPVGVVWIDLSKPHYGIHGTGEPHTIGRAESHGCVRLTNWDAARLAGMVKTGVKAVFQP